MLICKYFQAGDAEDFGLQDTYCSVDIFSAKKSLDGLQELPGWVIPFAISKAQEVQVLPACDTSLDMKTWANDI